jgi:hypothetical protein
MTKRTYDNRSPHPLRREAIDGSYQEVTSPECVNWCGDDRAWNQNFTNAGNEGLQGADLRTLRLARCALSGGYRRLLPI